MSLFDEIEIEEVTDDDSSDDEHEEIVDNKDDDDELEIIVDVEDENSSDDEREEIIDDDSDDDLEVIVDDEIVDDSEDEEKKDFPDYDEVYDEEDSEELTVEYDDDDIFGDNGTRERQSSDYDKQFVDYDDIKLKNIVLNIENEDKKPFEYTLEDILNPDFNEVVHNYNPEKFLLGEDGRIGFDMYRYKTFQEANNNSISAGRKPTFTIWDVNVAFALAKIYYLCMEPTNTFGTCDKQVKSLIKILFMYQEDYKKIVDKYEEIIDELKSTDEFFLKHPNRISTGDIKVVGNDKETASTVLEFFEHLDDVCPLKDLVDAKDLDPDSKFDDIDDVVINS